MGENEVLEYFQEGYTNRDTSVLYDYVHKLFTEDIVIVGTGNSEYPVGIEKAAHLIRMDWKYRGDVKRHHYQDRKGKYLGCNRRYTNKKIQIRRTYFWKIWLMRYKQNWKKGISNKLKLLEIITETSELLTVVEVAGTKFVYSLE